MTFFSVDVETTSTNPFTGELTGFSIVALEGNFLDTASNTWKHLTRRISVSEIGEWDEETRKWWTKNKPSTWAKIEVSSKRDAAWEIKDFVTSFPAPHVFIAWPTSFDYSFMQKLFADVAMAMPFHYRTLDIKSFLLGAMGSLEVAASRNEDLEDWIVLSELPHDPYYDALAQATTFARIAAWKLDGLE